MGVTEFSALRSSAISAFAAISLQECPDPATRIVTPTFRVRMSSTSGFRRGRMTTGVPPLIAAEVGDLLQAVFAFGAHRKAPGVKKSQKAGRCKKLGLVFTHKLESFLTRYQDKYTAVC